jgi:23S rRNA pseudouridine2605 synthase
VVKSKRQPSAGASLSDVKRIGLARAFSKLGYCSRSQAVVLIRDGKVSLNGSVTRNPEAPVRLGRDRILVKGQALAAAEKIYVMLNKPRGLVTTTADEKGRDSVYAVLPEEMKRIPPVGRLDMASEGLLLFTNDSEWAAKITDPRSHLDKTYHVQVGVVPEARVLETIQRGVRTPEGEMLKAKGARILRTGQKNAWLEIVLDEGKHRHIRRMLDALGLEVLRLIRVSIGPVQLGELARAGHRALRSEEKMAIDRALRS